MAETNKSTKSGFSAEERAAMKAAAAERKASQKQQDLDIALAEAIAKLPDDEREMAETIDAIVREHAPMLASKTYYGMPGWARDGKVCVFMQPASKFKVQSLNAGPGSAPSVTFKHGNDQYRITVTCTDGTPAGRVTEV